MDIKLRARLSAYARVATFEQKPSDTDQEHTCTQMTPISREQIDDLFRSNSTSNEDSVTANPKESFIDSFFKE